MVHIGIIHADASFLKAAEEVRSEIIGRSFSEIFDLLMLRGFDWNIDYSKADDEELSQCARADFRARIIRMFGRGKPVVFKSVVYNDIQDMDALYEFMASFRDNNELPLIVEEDEDGIIIDTRSFVDEEEDAEEAPVFSR